MPEANEYHTIQKAATAEHKDRGSRFIAFALPAESGEEAIKKLKAIRKEHPKANHHCFAYRIGIDATNFRVSDDGEPSGTAGRPILGQIDSRGLVNIIIVVVRYFGGTLLGVPGLIAAYKTAASLALQLTPVVQKPILMPYRLSFDYTILNSIMMAVKQYNCTILHQESGIFCSMQIGIPKAAHSETVKQFAAMPGLDIEKL